MNPNLRKDEDDDDGHTLDENAVGGVRDSCPLLTIWNRTSRFLEEFVSTDLCLTIPDSLSVDKFPSMYRLRSLELTKCKMNVTGAELLGRILVNIEELSFLDECFEQVGSAAAIAFCNTFFDAERIKATVGSPPPPLRSFTLVSQNPAEIDINFSPFKNTLEKILLEDVVCSDATFLSLAGSRRLADITVTSSSVSSLSRIFSDRTMEVLADLSALEILEITCAGVTDKGLAALGKCQRLRELRLHMLQLATQNGFAQLFQSPPIQENLVKLELRGVSFVSRLPNLSLLRKLSRIELLNSNGFTSDVCQDIGECPKLEFIALRGNSNLMKKGLFRLLSIAKEKNTLTECKRLHYVRNYPDTKNGQDIEGGMVGTVITPEEMRLIVNCEVEQNDELIPSDKHKVVDAAAGKTETEEESILPKENTEWRKFVGYYYRQKYPISECTVN